MNKRSGRGRIRIKLEDIALFNYSKNPRVISYLPPLGDEEGEPGSKGEDYSRSRLSEPDLGFREPDLGA